MKKIMKISMSLLLIVSFIAPSFVNATTKNGSITIKNDPNSTSISIVDHQFGAYKVFDLSLGENNGDKQYRYTVDDDFVDFFKSKATASDDVSTPDKLNDFAIKYVQEHKDINALATEIKQVIESKKISAEKESGKVSVAVDKKEEVTINDLPLGYYIILDKDLKTDDTVQSEFIAAAALGTTDTNLVINLKASVPTIDKEIKHNDTGVWGNVGDNQIGDTVEYKLIAKVPTNLTGYTKYTYIVHDTLSEGLTFNQYSMEIYVGDKSDNKVLSEKYYDVITPGTKGCTFDINFKILEGIKDGAFKSGDQFYIYYTATLNENAVVANSHNDNTAYIQYSNNPYEESDKDSVKVIVKDYTFKLNALKTREDGKTPLPGAKFELFNGKNTMYFMQKTLTDGTNVYTVCTQKHSHDANDSTCTNEIISGSNGKFEIVGLDDVVKYKLVETQAPDGYNAIDPIEFEIEATYDCNGDITSVSTNADGIKKDDSTFELVTTIVNTTGIKLPGTGGMGTTIFILLGGFVMASAAGVLFIKSRKKSA